MVRSYLAILLFIVSSNAFAVKRYNPIAERFALTGEISGSTQASKGIVMLHDKQKRKNVFVKVGTPLPGMPRWQISRVAKDQIVMTNGVEEMILKRDKFFSDSSSGSGSGSGRGYQASNNSSSYDDSYDEQLYGDNNFKDDGGSNYNASAPRATAPYRTDVAPPPPLSDAYFPDDDFDAQ